MVWGRGKTTSIKKKKVRVPRCGIEGVGSVVGEKGVGYDRERKAGHFQGEVGARALMPEGGKGEVSNG